MERLSKEQWLNHALLNLAKLGFTSLKADTLAKLLGVSRGSFYWHFKDLGAFKYEVLEHWHHAIVLESIQLLETQTVDTAERLAQIINIGVAGDQDLERSIRAWALSDTLAKEKVNLVDQQRLNYLQMLLIEIGLDQVKAAARARIIYCGYLGHLILGEGAMSEAESDILIGELVKLTITEK